MSASNDYFYVTLSPRGRLTRWGQFNPKHPRLEQDVLVSPFSKWAAKQSGHQRLEDGEDFWVGPAPSVKAAVENCITAAEEFERKKK